MSEDQKKACDYFRRVAEWAVKIHGVAALDEMAASPEGAAKYAKLYNAAFERFFERVQRNKEAQKQFTSLVAEMVYAEANA